MITMEKTKVSRTFGPRPGHTAEIVNQIKSYLQEHPSKLNSLLSDRNQCWLHIFPILFQKNEYHGYEPIIRQNSVF